MSIWDTKSDFGVSYGGVSTPAYDWTSIAPKTDWYQTPDVDWGGKFDLPGLTGTGGLNQRSSKTDWLGTIGKGLEALNKARSYQSSRDENALDKYLKSGAANTNLVGQGRSWKMYQPSPRQKTTQTGGSSSPLGPIGSAVGIAGTALGVFGPLGPTAGATIGSLFA
jgi:hypothetical protein